ncbi:sugar transferase, partial [bacterium]|nr:sugar transferase [bacterium]MCI0605375.1 sugar transferase [bacterium]
VKPGITGWAQIHGRNATSFEERFKLDVWYVDHWTFFFDVKILFQTFVTTWRREGISAKGHPTMPEFLGSETKPLPGRHTE